MDHEAKGFMLFEYIRSIPSPVLEQELEPVGTVERLGDAPELSELVAHACALAPDDGISLACPEPPSRRVELPRFAGISLADVVLQASASPPKPIAAPAAERDPLPVVASLAFEPRVLLGPGAMTMTLAVMATLAFGVFVVTH
jgi:hypothetical protein